jgi:hypothetical protein
VVAAAGGAPVADRAAADETPTRPPGLYQITGRVRLHQPVVEISGITNAQQISWAGPSQSVASFSSFEEFHAPWHMARISVTGGQLEAVSVAPVDFSSWRGTSTGKPRGSRSGRTGSAPARCRA